MRRFIPYGALVIMLVASTPAGPRAEMPKDHLLWSEPVFNAAYKIIASPEEWTTIDTIARARLGYYLKLFWKKRDPTPTTPENEFKQQFEDRVEVAATRFRTIPRPVPWDERGNAYIRFGPPDDRVDGVYQWYAPEDTFRVQHGMPSISSAQLEYGEVWYYYSRNLKLQFQGWMGDVELVPFVSPQGEYQQPWDFAETVEELDTSHVAYILPAGTEELTVALECYPFRRADGNYDVYAAGAVPLRAMASTTHWPAADLAYQARLTVFDSSLATVWSDSVRVRSEFDRVPRGALAQNQWERVMAPGFYIFTAEFVDTTDTKHAVGSLDRFLVPYIGTARLELSPLVVAADVRPATDSSSSFVRNGKEIIPMPGHVFKSDQDVAFYHEVYNLTQNDSGVCSYRIVYAVYDSHNERAVLTAQNFHSRERNTFQAGHIPAAKLGKGKHILEVKTTDLITGVTKTALAGLKIE